MAWRCVAESCFPTSCWRGFGQTSSLVLLHSLTAKGNISDTASSVRAVRATDATLLGLGSVFSNPGLPWCSPSLHPGLASKPALGLDRLLVAKALLSLRTRDGQFSLEKPGRGAVRHQHPILPLACTSKCRLRPTGPSSCWS